MSVPCNYSNHYSLSVSPQIQRQIIYTTLKHKLMFCFFFVFFLSMFKIYTTGELFLTPVMETGEKIKICGSTINVRLAQKRGMQRDTRAMQRYCMKG